MSRLIIRPAALRHNLIVMHELCRRAEAECMFVFKEAPLHPSLVADILSGSPVRRLGLVAWPHAGQPALPGVEVHHVYAPFPDLPEPAATCSCTYVNSRYSLRTLAAHAGGNAPQLRLCLEAGDGRDGVFPEELPELCEDVRRSGLPLRGLSVNFACLSSEAPTVQRMNEASAALERIRPFCLPEADISAGGTDVLELASKQRLPAAIREIRCGTGVMLGVYPLSGRAVPEARQDAFRLESTILECRIKKDRLMALFDVGCFHTAPESLVPPFPGMRFVGASSAYASFDVTDCPQKLTEGMTLSFMPDYHSLSRALCSRALPIHMEQA